MDLPEIEWDSIECFYLTQNRENSWDLVNEVTYIQLPLNAEHLFASWGTIIFSRSTLLRGAIYLKIRK